MSVADPKSNKSREVDTLMSDVFQLLQDSHTLLANLTVHDQNNRIVQKMNH